MALLGLIADAMCFICEQRGRGGGSRFARSAGWFGSGCLLSSSRLGLLGDGLVRGGGGGAWGR